MRKSRTKMKGGYSREAVEVKTRAAKITQGFMACLERLTPYQGISSPNLGRVLIKLDL